MKRLAALHPQKPESARESPLLPYLVDVRRGLDTAACDMLPLAILVAKDAAAREALEKVLRPLAWSDDFRGRFEWAPAALKADIKAVAPLDQDATLVILQPDAYGLKGTVLAWTAGTDTAALKTALTEGLAKHTPGHKEAQTQIRDGHRDGVDWKTESPMTDPNVPGARGDGPPPRR